MRACLSAGPDSCTRRSVNDFPAPLSTFDIFPPITSLAVRSILKHTTMSNETLPPSLLPLLHRTEQLPPLFPKKAWNPSLTDDIDHMKDSPPAVRAALHLLNDDIDRAHGIAQADEVGW